MMMMCRTARCECARMAWACVPWRHACLWHARVPTMHRPHSCPRSARMLISCVECLSVSKPLFARRRASPLLPSTPCRSIAATRTHPEREAQAGAPGVALSGHALCKSPACSQVANSQSHQRAPRLRTPKVTSVLPRSLHLFALPEFASVLPEVLHAFALPKFASTLPEVCTALRSPELAKSPL